MSFNRNFPANRNFYFESKWNTIKGRVHKFSKNLGGASKF